MKKLLLSLSVTALFGFNVQAQTPLTTAVDFTVTTMDGDEINLFSLLDEGKYVAIDFFAYWCGTCAQIAPLYKQSYEQFGCNTGDVFYMSLDVDGTDAQTLTFETNNGVLDGAPTASGTGGGIGAGDAYGISALPTIILIAPNRQIVNQDIWPFSVNAMVNQLSSVGISPKSCTGNVGIEDAELTAGAVVAFPNPASDLVNLRFELQAAAQATVEVYDIMGQKVIVMQADNLISGENKVELPLAGLSQGHYTARISSAVGFVGQTRFSVMQ